MELVRATASSLMISAIGISTGGGFGAGVGVYNATTVSIVVE